MQGSLLRLIKPGTLFMSKNKHNIQCVTQGTLLIDAPRAYIILSVVPTLSEAGFVFHKISFYAISRRAIISGRYKELPRFIDLTIIAP